MTEENYKTGEITNPAYQRMLRPSCINDRISYLELMVKFYFSAIVKIGTHVFKDKFRAEISTSIQMMFTKAKMFLKLLEGSSHTDGTYSLHHLIDHTVLFTIVRTAYEQLCAFEVIYVLPDTEEKRIILQNAYIASGLKNRQKLFTKEALNRNRVLLESEQVIIDDCKKQIHETNLYKSLKEKEQRLLDDEIFNKGNFQLYFDEHGKLFPHLGWDQIRNYCNLSTDYLKGLYKYACNMAHPSYLGLIQYRDAYKDGSIIGLEETAIMQMNSVLSVFIMDFMERFPPVKVLYNNLDIESQFMISMYNHAFREKSKKSSVI